MIKKLVPLSVFCAMSVAFASNDEPQKQADVKRRSPGRSPRLTRPLSMIAEEPKTAERPVAIKITINHEVTTDSKASTPTQNKIPEATIDDVLSAFKHETNRLWANRQKIWHQYVQNYMREHRITNLSVLKDDETEEIIAGGTRFLITTYEQVYKRIYINLLHKKCSDNEATQAALERHEEQSTCCSRCVIL